MTDFILWSSSTPARTPSAAASRLFLFRSRLQRDASYRVLEQSHRRSAQENTRVWTPVRSSEGGWTTFSLISFLLFIVRRGRFHITAKMHGVTRSLCTFEDLRAQQYVSYHSALLNSLEPFSLFIDSCMLCVIFNGYFMAEIRYLLLFLSLLQLFIGFSLVITLCSVCFGPCHTSSCSTCSECCVIDFNHNKLLAATVARVFRRPCWHQHQQPITVKKQYYNTVLLSAAPPALWLAVNFLFLLSAAIYYCKFLRVTRIKLSSLLLG